MAAQRSNVSRRQETTPLLSKKIQKKIPKKTLYLLLLTGLLVSLSFAVTQVPLLYVFRLMTCEHYYETHPEPVPGSMSDRCSVNSIEAATARSFSFLSASTALFGTINLFITGWTVKQIGVKSALAVQVFWPALRLLVQNVGVEVGSARGLLIIQCSQLITIVGGPMGYLLALNSFVTDVVEHKERTGSLGMLQGCMFFGTAIGYLAGGYISDYWGIAMPFRVTLALFLTSTLYIVLFLPGMPPPLPPAARAKETRKGFTRLFGPLKLLVPQKWIRPDGTVRREYGALLLGAGAFFGVLATGTVPTTLQMYATDVFGFGTKENGVLVSLHSFLRGVFLVVVFPRITSHGRVWYKRRHRHQSQHGPHIAPSGMHDGETAIEAGASDLDPEAGPSIESTTTSTSSQPNSSPYTNTHNRETFHFDLVFTKSSLLADGLLSALATFTTQGWQMYLVAAILPFASGTGAAAKGTMLQMCPASERVEALSAITLLESVARLSTTLVFGPVFAALVEAGRTELVFVCIGAVSLLGWLVLLLCDFPAERSRRLDESCGREECL